MSDHTDDLVARRVNGFHDRIGMDGEGAFQRALQAGGLSPVLDQRGPGAEQPQNRPPLDVGRLHHGLGDKAVVNQLAIKGLLAA